MTENLSDIFLKEKPTKIILKIRRCRNEITAADLSEKVDTTYAHTVKVLDNLHEENLITKNKEGRRKFLELTEKGKNISEPIAELEDRLEDEEIENNLTGSVIST